MQLDERKKKILRAIVQDYINTAEPIGSRTIARKFNLGISPATIRNEMADLEEMGLIEQPHTSAGRVPSDAGYRYYVDCLLEPLTVSKEDKELIARETAIRVNEIQQVVAHISKLLSHLTSLTSIVMGPQKLKGTLDQLHFLPYRPGQAIMVVVKDNGGIENHVVDIDESVTAEDLQAIARALNQKMKGLTPKQLKASLLQEIYGQLNDQRRLIKKALEMIDALLEQEREEGTIYLGGQLNMLNQPEFRDLDKIKTLFEAFEEDETLKELITPKTEGLNVTIGGENKFKEFKDCSVISATYSVDGEVVGAIGVIGPTRMNYARVMALVDLMTKSMGQILKNFRF